MISRAAGSAPAARVRVHCTRLLLAALALSQSAFVVSARAAESDGLADMSLEQLMNVHVERVYGASKYDQRVTQAPASVTIVTADEIRGFGHRTLSDILRGVRGLYVSNDRNYSYLGIRGFLRPGDYNTRTLVLIDGHRMNENIYDGALLDQENMIDVDLVDRVEVIRGPSSSIYGSSAFFGVINLITKSGKSVNGSEVSTEVGNDGTYKARYTVGGVVGKDLEVLVSGSYYTSAGNPSLYYPEFDPNISGNPAAANHGVAVDSDAEHAYNLFTDIRYHDFTLTAFGASGTKMIPTGAYGAVFNSRGEYSSDQSWYLDLKYTHRFEDEAELLLRAFVDDAHYLGFYPTNYAEPDAAPDIVLNRDTTDGRWAGFEAQFTKKIAGRHTFVGGAEYRRNFRQVQLNYDDVEPRNTIIDDSRDGHVLGLYAQGDYALLPNLSFNGGVRFDDYFETGEHALSPRFGLIYQPSRETILKLLYGEAFRAPNAYEQAYLLNGDRLRPERIRTYEIVFEQYLQPHYKASISGYFFHVNDLINIGGSDSAYQTASNLGHTDTLGVEAEFEAKYENGLMARASFSVQDSDDRTGDETTELTNSPRCLGKLALLAPVWKNATAGFELQYYGAMDTVSGVRSSDFTIGNLTLTHRNLLPRLNAAVSVYNLFDAEYAYPASSDHTQTVIPQNGRGFRLKLDYNF